MRTSIFSGIVAVSSVFCAPNYAIAADLGQPYTPVQPVPPALLIGGFYLGTLNSVSFADNTSFGFAGGAARATTSYDTGYYTALRLGYGFVPTMGLTPRLEIEGGYGTQSVDTHTINGFRVNNGNSFGDTGVWQGYLNGYLDVELAALGIGGPLSAVSPYFGGGIGVADVNLSKQGVSATGVVMNNDTTGFAYHLDAGLAIKLQALGLNNSLFQGTTLDIGYRYSDVPSLRFTAVDGTRSKTDFTSNMATVGFRKQF